MDVASTLRKVGVNKVTLLYRRTRSEMPADLNEIGEAEKDGVEIQQLVAPVAFLGDEKLESIECQKMELGEPDSSGRRRPVPIDGEFFDLECSTVIAAISQEPDFEGLEEVGQDFLVNKGLEHASRMAKQRDPKWNPTPGFELGEWDWSRPFAAGAVVDSITP